MKILVAMPKNPLSNTFMTDWLAEEIEELGTVVWNESENHFTGEELKEKLKDIDICITGWGSVPFDEPVLENADRLKLIAYTGGTITGIVSDTLFERGITVLGGNRTFAESVAEGVIAYALASLRDIPRYSNGMQEGRWKTASYYNEGLLDQTVGLVGFGMIAKSLVKMLKPFRTKIKVFSKHISEEEMKEYNVEKASLEEIFTTCKIISIHSARTPETYHMIGKELLELIPDGALLINTARGSVIDEKALENELQKQRFKAVLDVYEVEPLPDDSGLRGLDNVILMPHMGGPTIDRRKFVLKNLIEDIRNYIEEKPLACEITKQYAANMSQ